MSSTKNESCDCQDDYPRTETESNLRVTFAFIILLFSFVLLIEVFVIKRKYNVTRATRTIFIYAAIATTGYHAMVISQMFSVLNLSCWLIVIFRLMHYAAFYWVGILYVLSSMMGTVKPAFIRTGNEPLYKTLQWILYVSAGLGVLSLVFIARRLCGVAAEAGFYLSAAVNVVEGILLTSFLLIKYAFIRRYIRERYENHIWYYNMLVAYLATNVVLCAVYYLAFYRYDDMQTDELVFYIFSSLVAMLFPLLLVFYFAQRPAENEENGKD